MERTWALLVEPEQADLRQAVPFLAVWPGKYLVSWALVNSSVNRDNLPLRKLQGSLYSAQHSLARA